MAALRGEPVGWTALGLTPTELLEVCEAENLTRLLYQRLRHDSPAHDWPHGLQEALSRHARDETARELLRQNEIVSVLDTLASDGIHAVLFKGTPLAYSVYEEPSARPRGDTDLLIPRDQVDQARRAMSGLGYAPTPYCDGELLFCQFELRKTDRYGIVHAFDVHWKISTQALFADLLSYDELAAAAVAVPALGPHARAAGPAHALLLACVHPVMHHRNVARTLWIYDVHLLASQVTAHEFDRFVDLAIDKRVAAIVADQLALTHSLFGTARAGIACGRLRASATSEPSAIYLHRNRRWLDELISNIRGLRNWHSRVRLLREVLLPSRTYMRHSYGLTSGALGAVLLPAAYVHRIIRGAWKVLNRRK